MPGGRLSWRLSREQAGGGALHDLGSHVLDLISFLLGRFGAVQALLETLIPRRPVAAGSSEQAPVEVDDLALLHLRMASGVPGLVEISRMGTGAVNDIQLELYGERGALRSPRRGAELAGGVRCHRPGPAAGRPARIPAPGDGTASRGTGGARLVAGGRLRAQPRRVPVPLSCARCGKGDRPIPTLGAGLHVQETMEAALRSSAAGRWVELAELAAGAS